MCGRFSIAVPAEQLALRFEATLPDGELFPHYNAAPSQNLPVITNEGEREIKLFRWGFKPVWSNDLLINIRSEGLATKRTFEKSLNNRRCLVLADGFYEWQKTKQEKIKIPMRITLKDGEPFAFAGLWEQWKNEKEEVIPSFTIITTSANRLMEPIHNRMPVILLKENEKVWLDNDLKKEDWLNVLKQYPDDRMTFYPISNSINKRGYDDPSLIKPLADELPKELF